VELPLTVAPQVPAKYDGKKPPSELMDGLWRSRSREVWNSLHSAWATLILVVRERTEDVRELPRGLTQA
jgi:hypothetical protein